MLASGNCSRHSRTLFHKILQNTSYQNSRVSAHILQFSRILLSLPSLINTSLQDAKCFSCVSLKFIDHFAQCVLSRIAMSMYQFTFRYCYFHVQARQCNSCNRHFSGCLLDKNVGESGYVVSLWSASTGYLASILSERALSELWESSVHITAEYPALPDHDSMNNNE